MYRIYMHSIKYAVQRSYCRHCVNCRAKKTTILLTTLHHIENWIKLTLICFDRLALKEEKKRREWTKSVNYWHDIKIKKRKMKFSIFYCLFWTQWPYLIYKIKCSSFASLDDICLLNIYNMNDERQKSMYGVY